jgi:MinD superfamily P-loop ATPase
MKELVIISGKGGTGKTSIALALNSLIEETVLADCDVDASNMPVVLSPNVLLSEEFSGGLTAEIKTQNCIKCDDCQMMCRFEAISFDSWKYKVDPHLCEGCGVCAHFCPVGAIEMKESIAGKWFQSETSGGMLFHAELYPSQDNSGKLVTLVRKKAREYAENNNIDMLLVDGVPGIGCPVIASITGASMVLLVTEPTVSGHQDLKRVMELVKYFNMPGLVCINKSDLNEDVAKKIEEDAKKYGMDVVGKIPYDMSFNEAQIDKKSIIEFSDGVVSEKIRDMWSAIKNKLYE